MSTTPASYQARQKKIIRTSIIGIAANLALAAMKIVTGLFTGSVSIVSDAMNNLSDSLSSVLTAIGTALSAKKPDAAHPFGYGRIEYMTSLSVAVIILVTGAETLVSSLQSVFSQSVPRYTTLSLVLMITAALVKIVLGLYTKKEGRVLKSDALSASGADALSDAVLTILVSASAALYVWWHISLDGIVGIVISVFIIKSGLEIVRSALDSLLGTRADSQDASHILKQIESTPDIISAHDLILHDYGPSMKLGTVNVEIDAKRTIGQMYPILHHLQMDIFKKYHIYLVFGFYSVDTADQTSARLRQTAASFAAGQPHILGFHGVFADQASHEAYIDIVMDFQGNREEVRSQLEKLIKEQLPGYTPVITIDTQFS